MNLSYIYLAIIIFIILILDIAIYIERIHKTLIDINKTLEKNNLIENENIIEMKYKIEEGNYKKNE